MKKENPKKHEHNYQKVGEEESSEYLMMGDYKYSTIYVFICPQCGDVKKEVVATRET